jgi:NTP pyrophosphatase (non-canonical NTP hydrolase)
MAEKSKTQIEELTQMIEDFRQKRDWKQFHKPKDVAMSLSLEAAEVVEHFQWKSDEEIEEYTKESKDEIGDELADVFYWVLLLSHDLDIDIAEAFKRKMKENEEKYPVEKAKGSHDKYTDL